MRPEIRPAVPGDATEWLRMRDALHPGDPDHPAEIAAYFEAADPAAATLVAERPGGGLAGFVEVGTRGYAEGCAPGPVGYVEAWYVEPDLRRRGLGAALIRAAEAWARAAGFREIASDTQLDNHASQAAHRALGFEEVERIVCYRRPLDGRGPA